ncbi:nucleotide exchange factor GrpE [Granulosicoccus sp. 3-233]|uniref:nucleotide exchange factor GrpE n=1 Tax=Granulosicoccus sp. 3-233 TaxID=3417969 RepID=UPI003D3260C7
MMPDKTEASDNAVNESLGDKAADISDDSVVSEQNGAASVDSDATAAADAEQAASGNGEEQPVGANAADENDPLGFGDERMGTPEGEADDELGQLRARLAEAEAQASDHWDRLLRLQAEMENQRKRAQNDVSKARKFALEGIVGDLLPVKDSLEMGLAAAQAEDADPEALIKGADLTLKMLAQVFEKNNIVEINPVDEKFDPEFHQAMSMQEIEGKPSNTVTSVMQKGYTLNERLVRPALVMVAK